MYNNFMIAFVLISKCMFILGGGEVWYQGDQIVCLTLLTTNLSPIEQNESPNDNFQIIEK
jgi:hypothetical protein